MSTSLLGLSSEKLRKRTKGEQYGHPHKESTVKFHWCSLTPIHFQVFFFFFLIQRLQVTGNIEEQEVSVCEKHLWYYVFSERQPHLSSDSITDVISIYILMSPLSFSDVCLLKQRFNSQIWVDIFWVLVFISYYCKE